MIERKKYWMEEGERVGAVAPAGEFLSDPRVLRQAQDERLDDDGEFSRRDFLKLMGITTVLAGAAACSRRPVEQIIPYLNKPEEVVPGEALWYASTSLDCHCQCGVLVKTREGRPIKLEGNPDHPVNRGGLCARTQAALWNLYDPDRLQAPLARDRQSNATKSIDWNAVDQRLHTALRKAVADKRKIRLLTGATTGPSLRQIIQEFCAVHGDARHVVYEPVNTDAIARARAECYGGSPRVPHYRFDRAEYMVSLGADFLGTWISPVEFAKDWAVGRKIDSPGFVRGNLSRAMSRLVCFEPNLSLTGTNADTRYPVRASDLVTVAFTLVHEIGVVRGGLGGEVAAALAPFAIKTQAPALGIPEAVLHRIADELLAARGKALVVGGTLTGRLGVALQVAVNTLNHFLGAEGNTVEGARSHNQAAGNSTELHQLLTEMSAGEVDVLISAGVNPIYSLPKGLGLVEALKKIPLVVHVTDRADETAAHADLVLPVSHFLESWGDAEPEAGVYSLVQPTIAPLYTTRTLAANLIAWMNGAAATLPKGIQLPEGRSAEDHWYEYLRAVWRDRIYPKVATAVPFEQFWEGCLRNGAVAIRGEVATNGGGFNTGAVVRATQMIGNVAPAKALQLVGYPTVALYDGRYANNSWLQELPDPVTKITWDNYLCMAPRTAKRLGLAEEDVVQISPATGDRRPATAVELPIHIQPGTHEDVVAVPIGYGRTAVGRAGNNVGVRVHDLFTIEDGAIAVAGMAVDLVKTGTRGNLAVTQGHHRIEGRPIIQETTLAEYQKDPHAGALEHHGEGGVPPSMWEPHKYPKNRWAMAIDLSTCTGCSACVIGCQVENNVPAVGKKQVLKGREMHWIRIDRYYSGAEANPDVVHQPMLCQHCEKAPCETVCPTLATLHNDEGLNVQVYNRCVGTRYCSNNCPYKVRRFNWFDYGNKRLPSAYVWHEPLHLMLNPDVTVREKGIMEKCTFCIQRIRKVKEDAKAKGIPLADGAVKTACQQSCPTEAIVFGNINDPESQVAKLARSSRGYTVLRELNTLPQVTYMTKVRNRSA